jgi:hypothetical protein
VFFGRQRELKALVADIERAGLDTIAGRKAPRARVLLIAGRPGSGRSALAQQLALRLGDRYPDGILHVRLGEPDGRPVPMDQAARGLLDRLRIASPPGAGDDELTEMVREALAVRRVLLLVDDATDAEQVDLLLPQNPDCLVVAVSQGPLTGIPDVRPCTLGGMDAKAAIELLTTFTGSVRITVDPQAAEDAIFGNAPSGSASSVDVDADVAHGNPHRAATNAPAIACWSATTTSGSKASTAAATPGTIASAKGTRYDSHKYFSAANPRSSGGRNANANGPESPAGKTCPETNVDTSGAGPHQATACPRADSTEATARNGATCPASGGTTSRNLTPRAVRST